MYTYTFIISFSLLHILQNNGFSYIAMNYTFYLWNRHDFSFINEK